MYYLVAGSVVGSIKLAPHFALPNHHWQNFLCFQPRFPHCLIKFAFSFQRFQENVKLNNLPVKNMLYKGLIFEYFLVLVYFHELGKTFFRHKKKPSAESAGGWTFFILFSFLCRYLNVTPRSWKSFLSNSLIYCKIGRAS